MIVVAMTDHQGVHVRHAQRSQGRHDGPLAGIEPVLDRRAGIEWTGQPFVDIRLP